ncbi:MAG: replication initiator [Pseudonocardiaceae bacterium]|jgi:hypothetical protein
MRRIDTTTGRVDIVPVPCGSTREDQCRPCADKARQLRMAQCRRGTSTKNRSMDVARGSPCAGRAKPKRYPVTSASLPRSGSGAGVQMEHRLR